MVIVSQAAITKYHKLCILNSRNEFSHNVGGWESRSRNQHDWALMRATPLSSDGGRDSKLSGIPPHKNVGPNRRDSLMTVSKSNYLPKSPSLNNITLGVGHPHMNLGAYNSIHSNGRL